MKRLYVWGFLALLITLTVTEIAQAHVRTEAGPYTIIIGWRIEPVVVGERNAFTVQITEGEEPVTGAEATLNLQALYGGRTYLANINPTTEPGLYEANIVPTIRGQYEVRLYGTLGDLEIDETLEPEEVFPAARIQFPEAEPDLFALEDALEEAQAQTETAQRNATIGMVLGGLGLILGIAGIFLALKK